MNKELQKLILNNYKNKITSQIIDGKEIFGIFDKDEFLPLENPVYQERILFNLGPREIILGHSKQSETAFRFEHQTLNDKNTKNRTDAVFVAHEGSKNRVVAIFENKIAQSLDGVQFNDQINNTLKEVVLKYLVPYYENYQLLVSDENRTDKKNDLKPILHICLMFYYPLIYLKGKEQLIYYLNSLNKNNPSEILNETGFFCYNLSLSAKDILLLIDDYKNNNKTEPKTILQNYYKKNKNLSDFLRKESNNFPSILVLEGNPKRGPWADANYYSFDCRLSQLMNIPLWNINPDSKINNTRDLNKDTLKKQFVQISDTLCHNYLQYKEKVQLNEIYIGTGAKAREISYDFYKTVSVWLKQYEYDFKDWTHNMRNKIMYISCDMSSIDGQHSTTTILDILNMLLNEEGQMSEDGVGFKEADRIFKKSLKKNGLDKEEKPNIEKFLLENQLVEINIKGFANPDLAKRNSQNQNNISEQSQFEKFFDTYKSLFKLVATFFNEHQKLNGVKSYIPITKDAFSLPAFRDVKSNYKTIPISYIISIGALLSSSEKVLKNSYFSSNASSPNTLMSWKKAKEIYFEKSDFLNTLHSLLNIKLKRQDDLADTISFCQEMISEIKTSLANNSATFNDTQKTLLGGWVDNLENLKLVIPSTNDDNVIQELLNKQYVNIEKEIEKVSVINKKLILFVGNFIHSFLTVYESKNFHSLFSNSGLRLNLEFYNAIYLISVLKEQYATIDALLEDFTDESSFIEFFEQVNEHISKKILSEYTDDKQNINIPESLSIGGSEKEVDHDIIKKLYEFKFVKNEAE